MRSRLPSSVSRTQHAIIVTGSTPRGTLDAVFIPRDAEEIGYKNIESPDSGKRLETHIVNER
jgi:hypothetical protein